MKSPFFRIGLSIIVAIIVLVCAFSFWITYRPRDISYITQKVITVFETLLPGSHLEIHSLTSQYESLSTGLHVQIKGITLKSPTINATIPELDLHYSPWHLIRRDFIPKIVKVSHPVIYLLPPAASTSPQIAPPIEKIQSQMNIHTFLASYIRKPTNIPSIQAKNIDIVYFIKEEKRHFFIHNISMAESVIQKKQLDFDLSTYYLDQEGTIKASLSFKDPGHTVFNVAFIAFPMTLYSEVMKYHQKENKYAPYIEGILHATGNGLFDHQGFLKEGSFTIDKTHAHLSLPALSDIIYPLENIEGSGRIEMKDDMSYLLSLHQTHFTYNTHTINGDMNLDFPSPKAEGSIQARLSLDQWEIESIKQLWQSDSEARKWFGNTIKEGHLSNIAFSISAPFTHQKGITIIPENIALSSDITNTTIDYFSPFPPLKAMTASVDIKDGKVDFYLKKGQFEQSSLQKSHFIFEKNIKSDNYSVSLQGETSGDIKDILTFVPKNTSPYASLQESGLFHATGLVNTRFSLTIPFTPAFSFEDLGLKIEANTQNLSIPDLYKKNISLSEGYYAIEYSPTKTHFSGDGVINGKKMHHSSACTHNGDFSTIQCDYSLDVPMLHESDIKALKLEFLPKIEGPFGAHIEGSYSPSKQYHTFSFDLTSCKFMVPALRWTKPKGENTQFKMELSIENKKKISPDVHFSLDSKYITTEGNVSLTPDLLGFTSLHISKIKNKFYDLTINYENTSKKSLYILGKLLDIEGLDFNAFKNFTNTTKEPAPNMLVHVDIDALRVKNQQWEKFFLSFEKKQEKLDALVFDVRLPNQHFASCRFDKKTDTDQEISRGSIQCMSDDAGGIFSGLGISSKIGGGYLTLTAQENDKNIYEGQLEILSFALIKAPILGKLLSLISLTSILQQLNGKGIIFDRLLLPFSYTEKIITVHNGKISGPAVGFSFEGKIDTNKETFNCQGTVIPAQFLNNLFSHIPLLGPLLGGEGGLIAASYSITGTFNDPHVFTNPLSILTPGLLRKVFDILPSRK